MNKCDLQESIKNVDKKIIDEAGGKKKKNLKWLYFATPAACILLVAAIVTTTIIIPKNSKYSDGVVGGKSVLNKISSSVEEYIGMFSLKKSYDYEESVGGLPDVPEPYEGDEYTSTSKSTAEDSTIKKDGDGTIDRITAGTLTAGEWKDLSNIEDWVKLINDNNWYEIAKSRNVFTNNIIKVIVKDGENFCYNVPAELLDDNGKVLYSGRTDVNGECFLLYNVDTKTEVPSKVKISDTEFNLDGQKEITVDVKDAGTTVKELDLMLMIDTTGSMSDELNYLQAELEDMVSRVAQKGEQLSIRVSVNFYRDEGDDYVVKYYDFRTNIKECVKQISEETAAGGGDFPEAVHTALDNAVNSHQWRTDAVKLCFMVLDAPPHSEDEVSGVNESLVKSLEKASEEGIRVIPIMCSGADDDTEYTLRSFAVMTGGTYVFLTNDSGVGGDHHETTVGEYTVEFLNDCMVRIVCEYCGLEK